LRFPHPETAYHNNGKDYPTYSKGSIWDIRYRAINKTNDRNAEYYVHPSHDLSFNRRFHKKKFMAPRKRGFDEELFMHGCILYTPSVYCMIVKCTMIPCRETEEQNIRCDE